MFLSISVCYLRLRYTEFVELSPACGTEQRTCSAANEETDKGPAQFSNTFFTAFNINWHWHTNIFWWGRGPCIIYEEVHWNLQTVGEHCVAVSAFCKLQTPVLHEVTKRGGISITFQVSIPEVSVSNLGYLLQRLSYNLLASAAIVELTTRLDLVPKSRRVVSSPWFRH
jgi:hypothetical protein